MASIDKSPIAEHYRQCWGEAGVPRKWERGPISQLPVNFQILVFAPTHRRAGWTYATSGMATDLTTGPALELYLISPVETNLHVELLTVVAHYHRTGAPLGLGHTVNFGRAWLPGSLCDHGLISLPYLDGPSLEWLDTEKGSIRFLWLIPITNAEVAYKKAQGLEALEARFEESQFNYLNPTRASVA
jgi:hypothetical protein